MFRFGFDASLLSSSGWLTHTPHHNTHSPPHAHHAPGNTCYLNSTLQCLSHLFPLVKYFATGAFRRHINTTSKDSSKGVFAKEFGE